MKAPHLDLPSRISVQRLQPALAEPIDPTKLSSSVIDHVVPAFSAVAGEANSALLRQLLNAIMQLHAPPTVIAEGAAAAACEEVLAAASAPDMVCECSAFGAVICHFLEFLNPQVLNFRALFCIDHQAH